MADRFYIGLLDSNASLQTSLKPFAIPDNAFARLDNAFVFRGRVKKRFGSRLMQGSTSAPDGLEQSQSRFKINIGVTNGSGNLSVTVPGAIFEIGQAFSVDGTFFTVTATGVPASMLISGNNIGVTDSSGDISGTVPGGVGAIGQTFKIGTQSFTVTLVNGALTTSGPATGTFNTVNGDYTFTGAAASSIVYWFAGSGTYNTTTGALVITNSVASTTVYFYPAQPVMGLLRYQQPAVNIEDSIGFDTQFAYQFSSNGWERLGTAVWKGDDSSFFLGYTGRGTSAADYNFFVTNYFFGTNSSNSDPMRFWNGATWTNFTPGFTSGTLTNIILTSRIIVNFKNRLLLLNVVENTTSMGVDTNIAYVNRVRWSWIGDPTNSAAFYDNVLPGGGFEDAPTKEAIITAQFLKDRLIVYFEASTWELVYTGNQVAPFVWQKINTELGAESTFSQVPFDKVVLGVGNVGVHACNGSNVERVDEKIPDSVFDIHVDYTTVQNDGIARIYGIRDYFAECVYWTFPDQDQSPSQPFNNRVLVYNYKTGSWAFNDDSITAFGYYTPAQNSSSTSLTWAQAEMEWQEADFAWRSPTSLATFTSIIAGNQQGYTFIIDNDLASNAPALQMTNITLPATEQIEIHCINHNIRVNQYVKITDVTDAIIITRPGSATTNLNNGIYQVALVNGVDRFLIDIGPGAVASGSYTGGGLITRVTPIDILTKQYNFYANDGRNALVSEVDFLVDRTTQGQCTVDFLVSSSDTGIIQDAAENGSLLGTSVLDTKAYDLVPYEAEQQRLWHAVYMWADGEYVQLHLYLNDEQTKDNDISETDFELHAMVFYARPSSSRLQ